VFFSPKLKKTKQTKFFFKKVPIYGTSVITDTMHNDIKMYGIVKNSLLGEAQLYILHKQILPLIHNTYIFYRWLSIREGGYDRRI
jgi:hypothetical protein